MSVLIKGMEMPKNCRDCPFFVRSDSPKHPFVDCKLIGCLGSVFNAASGIPVDCPLVPVPPHGRLIDADALIVELMDRGVEGLQTGDWHEIQQAVADAPTILEAEEGE